MRRRRQAYALIRGAGHRWPRFFLHWPGGATHGHSVGVEADEDKRAVPPRALYHETPVSAFESIAREGLRPMTRRAVHLASTPAATLQIGRRRGTAVLLEVDVEAMHGTGAAFYQTSEGVWLTAAVPPAHLLPLPWYAITTGAAAAALKGELVKELAPLHALYKKQQTLTAVWRQSKSDEVLFTDAAGQCYNVHLTWRGAPEPAGPWPLFKEYESFNHWLATDLIADQTEFYFG